MCSTPPRNGQMSKGVGRRVRSITDSSRARVLHTTHATNAAPALQSGYMMQEGACWETLYCTSRMPRSEGLSHHKLRIIETRR